MRLARNFYPYPLKRSAWRGIQEDLQYLHVPRYFGNIVRCHGTSNELLNFWFILAKAVRIAVTNVDPFHLVTAQSLSLIGSSNSFKLLSWLESLSLPIGIFLGRWSLFPECFLLWIHFQTNGTIVSTIAVFDIIWLGFTFDTLWNALWIPTSKAFTR